MPRSAQPSSPRPRNPWFAELRAYLTADAATRGAAPDLTIEQVLAWADQHRERTGVWPTFDAGVIPDSSGETWMAVETALTFGLRGLPSGGTLVRLLHDHRGRRNRQALPLLDIPEVLRWADDHHRCTGSWPRHASGPVTAAPGETWGGANAALTEGLRGLPGGITLAELLAQERGVRHRLQPPKLTRRTILQWARDHRRRIGVWPIRTSGAIAAAPDETWDGVDRALQLGLRGLAGGTSLGRFLAARRRVVYMADRPPLTVRQIVVWSRAHRRRTGSWPTESAGAVAESPGESWAGVATALRQGGRGLAGGSSLVAVLARYCGQLRGADRPPLTETRILRWADRHHRRHDGWPHHGSGPVEGAAGETWREIDRLLRRGGRGLPGGSTLTSLLGVQRGYWPRARPRLTEAQILHWADLHHQRTGEWPQRGSGPILDGRRG